MGRCGPILPDDWTAKAAPREKVLEYVIPGDAMKLRSWQHRQRFGSGWEEVIVHVHAAGQDICM